MADNKGAKMGVGLLIGMVVGAIGGIFLAPKSGKENREAVAKKVTEWKEMMENGEFKKRVEEIFGDLSDESMRMYGEARKGVMDGIETMKNMDGDDYAKLVQKVVDNVKDSSKTSSEKIARLKDYFIKNWPKMREEVEKKGKEEGKKIAKG